MIRLDGQTRIAPHYYIEAMFKQVKYPTIEGFIKFGDLLVHNDSVVMQIDIYIFNWSPLQNEKNIHIMINSPQGTFGLYNSRVYNNNRYEQYSLEGHQIMIKKLDDILFFGSPFHHSYKLIFDLQTITYKQEFELIMQFGGESSPHKQSYYKFKFVSERNIHLVKIIELDENKLVSDLQAELGHKKYEVIKKIVCR